MIHTNNRNKRLKKPYLLKFVVIMALLIYSTNFIYSQVETYTLDEAIATALKNNHDKQIAEMNIRQAEKEVDEAFGYALPRLDLTGNYTHFLELPAFFAPENFFNPQGDPNKLLAIKVGGNNAYDATAQFSQTVFNATVFRGIGASQIYLDLSKKQYESAIANTILKVKQAFYGVLVTQEALEISRASLENAEENVRNVKALGDKGFVSEFDMLQAEVQLENFRPIVLQTENMLKDAKNGLKMILGIKQESDVEVVGVLEYKDEQLPDANLVIQDALKRNFDVQTLELKKLVDEEFIAFHNTEYYPTVAAFANYTFNGQAVGTNFATNRQSVVGLQLQMNLFNGFQTQAKVEKASIEKMKTSESISQLSSAIAMQVKSKISEIEVIKNQIKTQEKIVNQAERAFKIANTRYKEGAGNQLEIQNADIALRQSKTNLLQSVYKYISAKAELDQLTGNVSPKYLNFNN